MNGEKRKHPWRPGNHAAYCASFEGNQARREQDRKDVRFSHKRSSSRALFGKGRGSPVP